MSTDLRSTTGPDVEERIRSLSCVAEIVIRGWNIENFTSFLPEGLYGDFVVGDGDITSYSVLLGAQLNRQCLSMLMTG